MNIPTHSNSLLLTAALLVSSVAYSSLTLAGHTNLTKGSSEIIGRYNMSILHPAGEEAIQSCSFHLSSGSIPGNALCDAFGGVGVELDIQRAKLPVWLEVASVAPNGDITGRFMRVAGDTIEICPTCSTNAVYSYGSILISDTPAGFTSFFNDLIGYNFPSGPGAVFYNLQIKGNKIKGFTNNSAFSKTNRIKGKKAPLLNNIPETDRKYGRTKTLFGDSSSSLSEKFKFIRENKVGIPNAVPGELVWHARGGEIVLDSTASVSGGLPGWFGDYLVTKRKYKDFNLTFDLCVAPGSNSGVYLRGRYEMQVLGNDQDLNSTLTSGAIYSLISPTSNEIILSSDGCSHDSDWNAFEITLVGRYVSVVLNGVTIIDNKEIAGPTGGAINTHEAKPGPIAFQAHLPGSGIKYRRINVTKIFEIDSEDSNSNSSSSS